MKYKKELIVIVVVSILVLLLRLLKVFQDENYLGKPIYMLIIIILISALIIPMQRKIDHNYEQGKLDYYNLDILRYIFSVIVIIAHFRPFVGVSDQLDLVFNNIVSRACVPFFFLITGYFVAKKEKQNPNYIKDYLKSMIPLYLVWSAIYLPVMIGHILLYVPSVNYYISNLNLPLFSFIPLTIIAIPLVLTVGLLYTGVYYHLWYFPALFLSLIVLKKWKQKFSIKPLLVISFILLLFGATETYYGFFSANIQKLLSYYYNIFFTTRNFLFFGLFYVVFGYYVGMKERPYKIFSFLKFISCIFFLIAEAIILQTTKRLNSNILLSCVFLIYYLFLSFLYVKPLLRKNLKYSLRDLSKYYYFIHPLIIFLFQLLVIKKFPHLNVFIQIFIIIILTHLLSILILKIKKRYPKLII